ncbi:MAG: hypothetical protein JKY41_08770 [Rhodobacteraceae bacterium]|nr:hypothetical protein [Paracoccaceae bacterium]
MIPAKVLLALFYFSLAAVLEIAGSYAVWMVFRLGKSQLWLIPGTVALLAFAFILTKVDVNAAGRAYAAYGGIYVTASIFWLWRIEGRLPDIWDISGVLLVLAGTLVMLAGRYAGG